MQHAKEMKNSRWPRRENTRASCTLHDTHEVDMWEHSHYILFTTSSTTSVVLLFPPRSGVRHVPSRITSSTARSIRSAPSPYPRWRSMSAAERMAASGFAMFCPAISGADPWTLQNKFKAWPHPLRFRLTVRPLQTCRLHSLMARVPETRAAAASLQCGLSKFGQTLSRSDNPRNDIAVEIWCNHYIVDAIV